MIVTCKECDTSFQLDDSRIPAKGIRVRCSRCKCAFFLAHPSVSQSEAVDSVAQEAVTGSGIVGPGATQDLVDPQTNSSAPASANSPTSGDETSPDEEEWEFNHDPPEDDSDSGDVGSNFRMGSMDDSSGLDLAGDSDDDDGEDEMRVDDLEVDLSPPESSAEAMDPSREREDLSSLGLDEGSSEAEAEAGSEFGSVDDFSSLMEEDDIPLDVSTPESDQMAASLRDTEGGDRIGSYAEAGGADDLGDPESWDLFDGDNAPRPAAKQGSALGQIDLKKASELGSAVGAVTSDWAEDPEPDLIGASPLAQHASTVARVVGWAAVVVLLTLGLSGGLWTTAESFVAAEHVTQVGTLEAANLRAAWVDTARSGRLLVVSGGLRNSTNDATILPGPLEIALLDSAGRSLEVPFSTAGIVLGEDALRELPMADLKLARVEAAKALTATPIAAGGLVPFQAVIFEAPKEAVRFQPQLESSDLLPPSTAQPMIQQFDGEAIDPSVPVADLAPQEGEPLIDQALIGNDAVAPEALVDDAPVPMDPAPVAPSYDDPYGDDAGLGLRDL